MAIKSFKDLEIWKRSVALAERIYKLTNTFPKNEVYGLSSQIRRAVVSIPSNIAEGFARFHNREYKQFLYVSLGSGTELTTQMIIAANLGYVDGSKADKINDEIEQISKMIMSLIKKLS